MFTLTHTIHGVAIAGTLGGSDKGGGWRNDLDQGAFIPVANPLGAKRDGGWRGDLDNDTLIAFGLDCENLGDGGNVGWHDASEPSITLNTGGNVGVAHILRAAGGSEAGTGRGTPLIAVDWNNSAGGPNSEDAFMTLGVERTPAVMTLAIRGRGDSHDLEYRDDGTANAVLTPNGGRAGIGVGAVAFHQNVRSEVRITDVMGALNTGGGKPGQGYPAIAFDPTARQPEWSIGRPLKTDGPLAVQQAMSVRRLTPVECERLQGFPDSWTAITYRGKPAADGPRYRAIGNSMAVPVVGWVLQRVQQLAAASLERAA